jgi:hypothetical protein
MPPSRTTTLLLTSATALTLSYSLYTYLTYSHRWWWKTRTSLSTEVSKQPSWEKYLIHGYCDERFIRVKEEFIHNFRTRGELGAGVCIFFRGKKVRNKPFFAIS